MQMKMAKDKAKDKASEKIKFMHRIKNRKLRILLKALLGAFVIALVACLAVLCINLYIINSAKERSFAPDNVQAIPKTDAALVLGSFVVGDSLSPILLDRVNGGIALYKAGKVQKLLLSGDHGQTEYDEVNAMMHYAIKQGVKSEDIFLDHAGFSTYESVYRARDIFQCKSITIVTQEFHLSRALFLARQLGVEAYGLDSTYHGNAYFDQYSPREVFARVKDFFTATILFPKPTYLGDAIPITGSGIATHDKGSN
ncbi:MAG: ElyC/SanA/YdcF family protein [Clostridia bacterium]